ncbi:unnamed protein product, partial [Rotaria sp. Silwood2]
MVFTSKTICETRVKEDSFGPIEVPAHCYYGAETARSMKHFNIGLSTEAFDLFKKVCAMVNVEFGLEKKISNAIIQACAVHEKIQWLDVESSSMKRILCAADYPNLHGLGLFNTEE